MVCDGCGNPNAYRLSYAPSRGCLCNACGDMRRFNNPDVFFQGPYLDPHLVDYKKPEQRNGVWIESRHQKAEIMKKMGVREAGDRRGGCRIEDKHAIRLEKDRINRSQKRS